MQYTFEVNNTIYISQSNVNGNKAEFDALKNSGNTEIEIKVTRTADGEVALSKTIKIKVLPKDIEIIIDDKQKKQGEENPELTFQDFQDQLVSWNGVKDQVDSNDVKLSTTATTTSKGGSYPITGNPKTMNGKFPNYNFIFKDGKLMVEGMIDKDVDGDEEPDFNDPDGDGCPDVNIKWQDEDGKPDINIDMDGDEIPDIDIDINGNGKPDINIDTDDDGKADENLYEINEWKPDKDSHKNGFLYDTIEIKQKTELEDNGITVENTDGTSFLPNYVLKVEDVTDVKQSEVTAGIKEFIKETQEVKKIYDVKLLKDNIEVQPNGTLKIKIPYDSIKNPILFRKNANGTYEKIEYKMEGNHLIYETDELGIVSMIGDKDNETSVNATYTANIGGALTGDHTNMYIKYVFLFSFLLITIIFKSKKQNAQ